MIYSQPLPPFPPSPRPVPHATRIWGGCPEASVALLKLAARCLARSCPGPSRGGVPLPAPNSRLVFGLAHQWVLLAFDAASPPLHRCVVKRKHASPLLSCSERERHSLSPRRELIQGGDAAPGVSLSRSLWRPLLTRWHAGQIAQDRQCFIAGGPIVPLIPLWNVSTNECRPKESAVGGVPHASTTAMCGRPPYQPVCLRVELGSLCHSVWLGRRSTPCAENTAHGTHRAVTEEGAV